MTQVMANALHCSECGAELDPALPRGLCGQCLISLGLATGPDETPTEDGLPVPENQPSDSFTSAALGRIGDYELLQEIARGGMGVVYKARQISLGRFVAVKMILAGQFVDKKVIQRFQGEVTTAALLNHPNIVSVHEVGMHAGQPFFSMDYVEGQNLAQLVGNRPLPPKKAARYLKLIAEAIQYAHSQGVLHRDLKPSNVLVDAESDQPHVADFGLARRLDGESSLTLTGQVLGSPGYAPPEQASANRGKVGRRSDVYGLGAILYHLLTARAPFQAESLPTIVNLVLTTEPVPPRLLNPAVPRDLETICLKCLEKEPARRYATAQELADDLGRFLNDEPILARPISPTARFGRWCRRKPLVAGLILALHLAFALGLAGVLWEWRRAAAGELSARQHRYVSDMNLGQQVWEEGNVKWARDLLSAHIPKPGESDLRGFEWRYLWKLCEQDDSRYAFTNFEDSLSDLAYSPHGKVLAVAQAHAIRLLDVPSRKELAELKDPDTNDFIYRVVWSPTATNILVTGGRAGVIKSWNVASREVSVFAYHPSEKERSEIGGIAFSPDGTMLAVASYNSGWTLRVWNAEHKKEIWATNTAISPCAVAFTKDGKALVTGGGENGNARVWDAKTGEELPPFPRLHSGWINRIAFSPDGRTLATRGDDSRIIVWDFTERRPKVTLVCPGPNVAVFSPDGREVASVGAYGIIRVWDATSGEPKRLFRGHVGSVGALAFAADGVDMVSSGEDRTVRVWSLAPSPDKNVLLRPDQNQCVNSLAFSRDGKRLVTGSLHRNWAEVWDVPARRWTTNLDGQAWSAVFSPDGKLLATGDLDAGPTARLALSPGRSGFDRTVRLWNAETLQLSAVLTNEFYSSSIAFSPDGKTLAVGCFRTLPPDGLRTLAFWDVASKGKLERLADAAPNAGPVAFSSDGRLLAIGYCDGWVRLWDYRTGRKLDEFRKSDNAIWAIALSPNGKLLASSADDNVVLYNVATRRVSMLEGHAGSVLSLVFAPDSTTLASAGDGGTIKLWNLATHEAALTLRRQVGPVYSVAFTRDGTLLASGGSDGDVRLWPAASFDEIMQKEMERK